MHDHARNRGITLLEMIVVLAIITILMGLTVGPVVQARRRGDQAVCANNLRQIYQALHLYDQDNAGLPPDFVALETTYVKSRAPFLCPADHRAPLIQTTHAIEDGTGPVWRIDYRNVDPRTTGGTTYAYACVEGYAMSQFDSDFILANDWISRSNCHQGGAMNLWADGHVKWTCANYFVSNGMAYFYTKRQGGPIMYTEFSRCNQ